MPVTELAESRAPSRESTSTRGPAHQRASLPRSTIKDEARSQSKRGTVQASPRPSVAHDDQLDGYDGASTSCEDERSGSLTKEFEDMAYTAEPTLVFRATNADHVAPELLAKELENYSSGDDGDLQSLPSSNLSEFGRRSRPSLTMQ